jgi:hypothetical protein
MSHHTLYRLLKYSTVHYIFNNSMSEHFNGLEMICFFSLFYTLLLNRLFENINSVFVRNTRQIVLFGGVIFYHIEKVDRLDIFRCY